MNIFDILSFKSYSGFNPSQIIVNFSKLNEFLLAFEPMSDSSSFYAFYTRLIVVFTAILFFGFPPHKVLITIFGQSIFIYSLWTFWLALLNSSDLNHHNIMDLDNVSS